MDLMQASSVDPAALKEDAARAKEMVAIISTLCDLANANALLTQEMKRLKSCKWKNKTKKCTAK